MKTNCIFLFLFALFGTHAVNGQSITISGPTCKVQTLSSNMNGDQVVPSCSYGESEYFNQITFKVSATCTSLCWVQTISLQQPLNIGLQNGPCRYPVSYEFVGGAPRSSIQL